MAYGEGSDKHNVHISKEDDLYNVIIITFKLDLLQFAFAVLLDSITH